MGSCWLKDVSLKSSSFRCTTHGKKRKNSLLSIASHQRCRPPPWKAYVDVFSCRNQQIWVLLWSMYWESSPRKVARCSHLMISFIIYSVWLNTENTAPWEKLIMLPLIGANVFLYEDFDHKQFPFLTSLKYCHSKLFYEEVPHIF